MKRTERYIINDVAKVKAKFDGMTLWLEFTDSEGNEWFIKVPRDFVPIVASGVAEYEKAQKSEGE